MNNEYIQQLQTGLGALGLGMRAYVHERTAYHNNNFKKYGQENLEKCHKAAITKETTLSVSGASCIRIRKSSFEITKSDPIGLKMSTIF